MVKYQMTRWGLFNSCIRDHKTNSYYSVITETYIVIKGADFLSHRDTKIKIIMMHITGIKLSVNCKIFFCLLFSRYKYNYIVLKIHMIC